MSETVLYHVYKKPPTEPRPDFPRPEKTVTINFLDALTAEPYMIQESAQALPIATTDSVVPAPSELGSKISVILNKLALILAAIGIVMIVVSYAPEISGFVRSVSEQAANYQLSGKEVETLSNQDAGPAEYQPAFDPKLPKENKIIINSIGIDSVIQEATYDNSEEALKKGVWRASDFGSPEDRKMPTIFAAHRYGYLAWSWNFRKTSSFMNLPKLKIGDTVTIIWNQRKYVYEIYSEDKGEELTDYTADLVLYTCESLTGPVRIFKYAKLLEI
jgi:sortase (surface protein transpeptidase)